MTEKRLFIYASLWLLCYRYNNGNILVADISKPQIISVLKDHHDEVTSLSWKPSADGIIY